MIFFLKIVIGCIVAILLLLGILLLIFRRFVLDCLAEGQQPGATPLAVHLNEDVNPTWVGELDAKAITEEFVELGFEPGLAYYVPEMPETKLLSLFNAEYCAVIYNIPDGVFCEIFFRSTDNKDFTSSNTPFHGVVDLPPHKKIVNLSLASPAQLFESIKAESQGLQGVQISNKTFRSVVEASYREDIMHSNAGGGVSREQFQIAIDDMKENFTPKQIDDAFLLHKAEELESWNDAAVTHFYETTPGDDDESTWDFNYFIVPNICDRRALLSHLSDVDLVDEDKIEYFDDVYSSSDSVELFARINEGRSPDLRATHVQTLEFPVRAELYRVAY